MTVLEKQKNKEREEEIKCTNVTCETEKNYYNNKNNNNWRRHRMVVVVKTFWKDNIIL